MACFLEPQLTPKGHRMEVGIALQCRREQRGTPCNTEGPTLSSSFPWPSESKEQLKGGLGGGSSQGKIYLEPNIEPSPCNC